MQVEVNVAAAIKLNKSSIMRLVISNKTFELFGIVMIIMQTILPSGEEVASISNANGKVIKKFILKKHLKQHFVYDRN